MKRMVNRLVIALVVCALASIMVVAKEKSERVTVPQDMTIGGTLVKKGEYKLKFDDQTGELSLLKNGKVVAKTSARLEKQEDKAGKTEFRTLINGDALELRSITFRGDNERIVVGASGSQTATAQ